MVTFSVDSRPTVSALAVKGYWAPECSKTKLILPMDTPHPFRGFHAGCAELLLLFIKGILTDRGAQEMLIERYWDVAELVEYLSYKHEALFFFFFPQH